MAEFRMRFGPNHSKFFGEILAEAQSVEGYCTDGVTHEVRCPLTPDLGPVLISLIGNIRNWTGVEYWVDEVPFPDGQATIRGIREALGIEAPRRGRPPAPPKPPHEPKTPRQSQQELRDLAALRAQIARAEAESRTGPDANRVPLDDVSYAVVDLETTGFGAKDRVVEVAIVCLDARLQVEREYVSLVNPKRDMGETPDIHGVTPAMASTAPPFSEVADDILAHLTGRVLVAHNADFDHDFLVNEFARLGAYLPHQSVICTQELGQCLVGGSCSLANLCTNLGVTLEDHHCALADARACAGLLRCMLTEARSRGCRTLGDLGVDFGPAPASAWPQMELVRTVWTRAQAAEAANYLQSCYCAPEFTRDQLLQSTVVLTGGLGDRAEEEAFLRSLGITVRGNVSRKTSLLVAADPNTLSGKAMKARELGVPIMDAATFWGILGGT